MRIQAPRGTHDVSPAEAAGWQFVEQQFHQLVKLYGYGEIRTPMFEDKNLFVRSSGETSDIVSKEMYDFKDKGGRDICLKPEGTAPAIRAFIEHSLGVQGAVTRLWYLTPIFRYDRPQKGRYRQSHQVGLELIGSNSPEADAEVIEITAKFYKAIGIHDVTVSLNSIGRAKTREDYRTALLKHAEAYLSGLDSEGRGRVEKNPLRLLDSKDPKAIEAMQGVPSILDYLEEESKVHFDRVKDLLVEAGINFEIRESLVRGLDYYTDTVFEVLSPTLGAQSSLCGGGRYDHLVRELGGPDSPSVGVAMGIERALMAMEASGRVPVPTGIDVYLVYADESGRHLVRHAAKMLRENGISAQHDIDGKSLKSQMKQADRAEARFAVIVGEAELAANQITVREMATSEQISINQEDLIPWISKHLPASH